MSDQSTGTHVHTCGPRHACRGDTYESTPSPWAPSRSREQVRSCLPAKEGRWALNFKTVREGPEEWGLAASPPWARAQRHSFS